MLSPEVGKRFLLWSTVTLSKICDPAIKSSPKIIKGLSKCEPQMKPRKLDKSWRGQRQGSGLEIEDAPVRATGRGDLLVQLI